METKICPQCLQEFPRKPNRSAAQFAEQRHCSQRCGALARSPAVIKACERCGADFRVMASRADARFCSLACRRHQIEQSCAFCGAPFSVKASQAPGRNTCSRACVMKLRGQEGRAPHQGKPRDEATRQRVSAGLERYYAGDPKKHWNYQGGGYFGRGAGWNKQRRAARKRDGYQCRCCGISQKQYGRTLPVHHIKPFREWDDRQQAHALENLITVCQSCHMRLEHGKIPLPTATSQ